MDTQPRRVSKDIEEIGEWLTEVARWSNRLLDPPEVRYYAHAGPEDSITLEVRAGDNHMTLQIIVGLINSKPVIKAHSSGFHPIKGPIRGQ